MCATKIIKLYETKSRNTACQKVAFILLSEDRQLKTGACG